VKIHQKPKKLKAKSNPDMRCKKQQHTKQFNFILSN